MRNIKLFEDFDDDDTQEWVAIKFTKEAGEYRANRKDAILGVLKEDGTVMVNGERMIPTEFVYDEKATNESRERMGLGKMFFNEDRSRRYGIRPGDVVVQEAFGTKSDGIVTPFDTGDNNAVYCWVEGEMEVEKFIPEWCKIITKTEDRK